MGGPNTVSSPGRGINNVDRTLPANILQHGGTSTASRVVSGSRWHRDAAVLGWHGLDDATRTSRSTAAAGRGDRLWPEPCALHAILSLLTFWACGGWIWVWLIVALDNKKRVQAIDAYGNPIVTPQQVAARQEQRRQQLIALAVIAVIVVVIVILSALIS
jgi:hypothetical protein